LTGISQLNVAETGFKRVITLGVHEDGSTVLVRSRSLWVTSVYNVSGEKCNFSSHVNLLTLVSNLLSGSEMLELKRFVESDHWLVLIGVVNG
jgi:hypothetical protein